MRNVLLLTVFLVGGTAIAQSPVVPRAIAKHLVVGKIVKVIALHHYLAKQARLDGQEIGKQPIGPKRPIDKRPQDIGKKPLE